MGIVMRLVECVAGLRVRVFAPGLTVVFVCGVCFGMAMPDIPGICFMAFFAESDA